MLLEVVAGTITSCVTVYYGIKWFVPWLLVDIKYLRKILPVVTTYEKLVASEKLLIDFFEEDVGKFPNKNFILFEDVKYTYQEVDDRANKLGRVVMSLGLKKDDTVALVHFNNPEFVWTYLGLLKIGVRVSMINTNLRGKALSHCIEVSETNIILVENSSELISAVNEVKSNFSSTSLYVLTSCNDQLPEGFTCLEDQINRMSSDKIDVSLRTGICGKTHAVFIFTSGTTGLPKAAVVTQKKLMAAYMIGRCAGVTFNDVVYVALPLYHSNALVIGIGCTVLAGGTVALAKKFSKSNFFKDVRKHDATVMTYIGELCRYLLTNEKSDLDTQHKLRVALGNGLRHDIFKEFQTRFGIKDVVELYASTEGAIGFINLFNAVGACGRLSPLLQKFLPCGLYKWDVENECLIRDINGLCIPVKQGEPGLLLVQINKLQVFDGYKGNKQLSTSKIVCDVQKKGDQYFNSGDLMSVDKLYFIYFKDRVGDTFRWKGENVSTTEVSNFLTEVSFIIDACVYGVEIPGCDGKAGMATLLVDPSCKQVTSVELKAISDYCLQSLPIYAVPMFLRIKWEELDMTSTIKQSKVKLKQEGIDCKLFTDPLFYYDRSSKLYKPVAMETYEEIMNQKIGF